MSTPQILVTNDDGIDSPGIATLAEALDDIGDVVVVAPSTEQSAMGRSLSYGRPAASYTEQTELQYRANENGHSYGIDLVESQMGYALSGSPCDCAIAGINAFGSTPDIVVSGCNDGPNLGESVLTRSGTVGAAIEAAYGGIPAVAVSTDDATDRSDYQAAARFTAQFVERLHENGPGQAAYFNLNVPSGDGSWSNATKTRPCPLYQMTADQSNGRIRVTNPMRKLGSEVVKQTPSDTDRAAFLRRKETSVSALALPGTPIDVEWLTKALSEPPTESQTESKPTTRPD